MTDLFASFHFPTLEYGIVEGLHNVLGVSLFTFHIASARATAHVLHIRLTPYMSCIISKLPKTNMVIVFEGRIFLSREARSIGTPKSTPTALYICTSSIIRLQQE